jgi:hypothetical protein
VAHPVRLHLEGAHIHAFAGVISDIDQLLVFHHALFVDPLVGDEVLCACKVPSNVGLTYFVLLLVPLFYDREVSVPKLELVAAHTVDHRTSFAVTERQN